MKRENLSKPIESAALIPDSIEPTNMTPDALAALKKAGFSRRNFLKGTGVLIVGFSVAGRIGKLGPLHSAAAGPLDPDLGQVDSWVAIAEDGSVTAYSGKCEFGQGFRTVQYQLIADELYVPRDRVTLILCRTGTTPDQGTTSGSQSHPTEFSRRPPAGLRQALATAREQLFRIASQPDWLGVPVDELAVENGEIYVIADPSQRVTYGQLIGGQQFIRTVDFNATPKDPSQYTVLGTSVPRYEIPDKVTGQFQYVQHVRLDNMVHGKVIRPPQIGAHVVSIDESSISHLDGNVRVVRVKDFVGVVANTEWQAIQAAAALVVHWTDGITLPDQHGFHDYMRTLPSARSYTVLSDDVDQKFMEAARVFPPMDQPPARYQTPYQMHGSIGSSCAVADVRGRGPNGTATIWSSTQGVYPQRDSVALILDIPREQIEVIFVEGSGCYGINAADTVCFDAALMSQAIGQPVRVALTRKDEMAWGENYGPPYSIDLRAGLNKGGDIIVWDYEAWTTSKGNRPNATTPGNIITGALVGFPTPHVTPGGGNPPTSYGNGGNADSSYGAGCVNGMCGGTGTVRSERILTHTVNSPFFTGPLRSPGRLQNTFANESFIDELAAMVQADPVQFRLRHLADLRLIDVLNAAANGANWETRPSPKPGNAPTGVVSGRGIACCLYEGNNGYCAMVVEADVDQGTGVVTVTRIVAAQDSGPVSNPDGLRNQMEGGALQGLSRAMYEEVTWDQHSITSINWTLYPVFHWGRRFTGDEKPVPRVETVLLDRRDQQQMGAGECSITLVAGAIANAIFDATGARVREVPFTRAQVLAALQQRG